MFGSTGYWIYKTDRWARAGTNANPCKQAHRALTHPLLVNGCVLLNAWEGALEPGAGGRPSPCFCSTCSLDSALFSGISFKSCCHGQSLTLVCLCMVLASGKVPVICWYLGYFFPVIFTNRRQFISLWLRLSSPSGSLYFQIVMHNSQSTFFLFLPSCFFCARFRGLISPKCFIALPSVVLTLGHFSPESPHRLQLTYLTLAGCAKCWWSVWFISLHSA